MPTRSQKRRNSHKEPTDNVSESLLSPILVQIEKLDGQNLAVSGAPHAKSP